MSDEASRVWAEDMSAAYDEHLVPAVFRPSAEDLASRVARLRPRVEDGEGETGAPREVVGVAAKVCEVLLERQAAAWWPFAVGIARSGADVLDARHPGRMIRLIVLRPQRFEAELAGGE